MNLVLLYGGRSGEHEVSLLSAASILKNIDRQRFQVIPVSIDKQGIWRRQEIEKIANAKGLKIYDDAPEVVILPGKNGRARLSYPGSTRAEEAIDVVFPMLHGPLGEDGTIQGTLELADVAYVGSGTLASALGMDKELAKRMFEAANIPVMPYVCFRAHEWKNNADTCRKKVEARFQLPVFVKPANMGSSVGVHKVKEFKDLAPALDDAFRYDTKVLVEQGIPAREIELSVIEELAPGAPPFVSIPGEVIPSAAHEFYSYTAKYLDDNGAEFELPAELSQAQESNLKAYARTAFETLGCAGFARVDFLVHQEKGDVYLNEINTLPGFTSISMFPKMLEASGMPYSTIVSRLIDLALRDYGAKKKLQRSFKA